MSSARDRLLALSAYPLAPYFWLRGQAIRRETVELPEAAGPTSGTVAGNEHAITIVVMGESTAAGVGAATHEDGLAGQLAKVLARDTGRTIHWHAVAAKGLTLRQIRRQLIPKVVELKPDAILLASGMNDLIRLQSASGYGRQLERFVLRLQNKLDGIVPILVSPLPDLSQFPAIPEDIGVIMGIRARFLQQASANMCRTLEAVVQLPRLPRQAYEAAIFSEDGFHPGPAGYRLWAELAARELRTVF